MAVTTKIKKSRFSADRLMEWIDSITTVTCTKCRKQYTTGAVDQYSDSEYIFDKGWIATEANCYCPDCAKKFLKL